jgi:hypothetical protein
MKTCIDCLEPKQEHQFPQKGKDGGRRARCYSCHYKRHADRPSHVRAREKNKERQDYHKSYNRKRPSQVYRGLVDVSKCAFCDFPYPDVHHRDGNHKNNDPSNLVAVCPNHHRLIHKGEFTV